ncbi:MULTISPECIES: ATP/GTP-binding protein [Streptomyces]|uniref:ATP/GTP-binding protein n=1 Tax=Streptomyces venezuelae TaxID=54571 RepID=A0A5P2APM7_STRVZ|nr:ATP/GTP-binding protein [Streptomyces venezuelae]QES19530.1 ATP/GTP-binding protein [Streptomyces venezuelae]
METDGTYESRDTREGAVPRPAGPPPSSTPAAAPAHPRVPPTPPAYEVRPATPSSVPPPPPPSIPPSPNVPPPPSRAPEAPGSSPVVAWLDAPRPKAGLGIWRLRHVPPPEVPTRLAPVTFVGMLIPAAVGLVIWSAWRSNTLPYADLLLRTLTPNDWWYPLTTSPKDWEGVAAHSVFDGALFLALVCGVGALGSWGKVTRHYLDRCRPPVRAAVAAAGALLVLAFVFSETLGLGWPPLPVVDPVACLAALLTGSWDVPSSPLFVYPMRALITAAVVWPFARVGEWPSLFGQWRARSASGGVPVPTAPVGPVTPRSQWPELRGAGEHAAADLLTGELAAGRMNDVDCARVRRGWRKSDQDVERRTALVDGLLRKGAAAGAHPSGDRDLPSRAATHDLLLGQVRLGRWAAAERTPHAYRGAGLALDPGLLGTSLLAVGPSGAGKTRSLVAPVVESLTLQALTGAVAVVAVGTAGAPLGPDEAYDVVIRLGDPSSRYDLDLYAGATDPDEAAGFLAEGLVGDMEGVETRRAATVLAQLIGPYRAAYGSFPTVPVLRELLEARPEVLEALLDLLPADGAHAMRRELESRIRQVGTATDVGPVLADRLTALDRPAFAEFFGGGRDVRPFSLRAVAQHPMRVRVSLPDGGHEEAGRLLNRLLLAQFQQVTRDRAGSGHFACLVLDDAAGALTAGTVRAFQRLRPQNAGVVLALRTLAEVPEALHGPLLAGVGCRMAFAGLPTWDGRAFAEAWGTERVETTEVAHHTVFADQPMTRAFHALRKLVTGKAVTTEAVTVREVERQRWSASDLAHAVPPGHAVLSLTHVRGEHTPPLLVELRG